MRPTSTCDGRAQFVVFMPDGDADSGRRCCVDHLPNLLTVSLYKAADRRTKHVEVEFYPGNGPCQLPSTAAAE